MKYIPEKGPFRLVLLSLMLVVAGISLLTLMLEDSAVIRGLITSAGLLYIAFLAYHLLMTVTLKYEIADDGIHISSAFNTLDVFIRWDAIVSYYRSITLLEFDSKLMRNKRYAFGKVYNSNTHEANHYFITSSKKVVFIHTKKGNYGLSPENIESFVSELNRRGVRLSKESARTNMTIFDLEGNKEAKLFMLYIIVIIGIILVSAFVLYMIGLVPPIIDISLPLYSYQKLQTSGGYLKDIIVLSMLILFTSLMFYLFLKALVSVENRYYYSLLYIPLIMSLVFLLHHIIVILRIFV